MSYFTAVISRHSRGWRDLDIDVDDAEDLDDLAELVRGAMPDAGPAIAVIEREDAWFALVRIEAEADPLIFVSDLAGASASRYADVVATAGDVDVPEDLGALAGDLADGVVVPAGGEDSGDDGPVASGEDELDDDLDGDEPSDDGVLGRAVVTSADFGVDDGGPARAVRAWAGDPTLLEDLGLTAASLVALTLEDSDDPASALAGIGEVCGFDEHLDALR